MARVFKENLFVCATCKKEFEGKDMLSNGVYCKPCSNAKRREYMREYMRKRREQNKC